MVRLTNPSPNPAIAGRQFTVTATGGTPPYTFTWNVDEGDPITVTQDDPTLTISSVPSGGELNVAVEDSTGGGTAETYPITSQGGLSSGS